MSHQARIEITPQSDDLQADIEMMQQDIDASGYDVVVAANKDGKIVLSSTTDSDLENMVSEEAFRECYLNGMTVKEVIGLISY